MSRLFDPQRIAKKLRSRMVRPEFLYVPSTHTDIRSSFRRAQKAYVANASEFDQYVKSLINGNRS